MTSWPAGTDHPRIRGEHRYTPSGHPVATGSSPHTRGARLPVVFDGFAGGIIPAYAGSTRLARFRRLWCRDHPRIRGEHAVAVVKFIWEGGSSPHTRGAPGLRPAPSFPVGIIPAYAGSTGSVSPSNTRKPDHPRIRGEHGRRHPPPPDACGSSPHTRGARCYLKGEYHASRIIPAYAGSTIPESLVEHVDWDHPRIRGEHSGIRGAGDVGVGIIPAYAGSTADALSRSGRRADHPRIRGEHSDEGQKGLTGLGSSPHTRGALDESYD